jgi:undecaprenyl-diphosphatase
MFEKIKSLDTELFLFLNGKHNSFFDPIMYWASNIYFWFPLYILILIFILLKFKRQGLWMLLFISIVIVLCDQISSHLIKNFVQRPRPSHESSLQTLIHLSAAGQGGLYGFISGHATNAFGLATFLWFVLKPSLQLFRIGIFLWAVFVSYSRIYNGVHYPSDVIVGAFIGSAIGYFISLTYFKFNNSLLITKT